MAGNAMVMISFKKIWSMSFTVAPLILRIAISFRRRFTSSFVYPINPMKTISKVTMPPIMTESRNFREQLKRIIENYILDREQLTNLFVLLDCRHEAQKIDLEFMEWLGESGVPFSIIFTKIDKISKGRLKENLKVYTDKLLETWEELPPIFLSSSEKKEGRDEILDYIESINNSLNN